MKTQNFRTIILNDIIYKHLFFRTILLNKKTLHVELCLPLQSKKKKICIINFR